MIIIFKACEKSPSAGFIPQSGLAVNPPKVLKSRTYQNPKFEYPTCIPAVHTIRNCMMKLRACETVWSAREIAVVALSAEQERHTEHMFHIVLSSSADVPTYTDTDVMLTNERQNDNGYCKIRIEKGAHFFAFHYRLNR